MIRRRTGDFVQSVLLPLQVECASVLIRKRQGRRSCFRLPRNLLGAWTVKRELRSGIRYVLAVQCALSRARCSGFACENSFHERQFSFDGYGSGTRFLSVTCGGCDGENVKVQLAHFARKLLKKTDITLDQVSVHLSSCMVTDNSHHRRCPHVAKIRAAIGAAGFTNITEGTYVSARAEERRGIGDYSSYPEVEVE